jgi:demethylmenaquinone methyltransferase / 2-methoxy-6-polyprenyl-1,4-benzoquinol methylase
VGTGESSRRAPGEPVVRQMFDGIAERYDLVNDVLSFGMARLWRRTALRAAGPMPGDRFLDLGCGTGMLGARLSRRCSVVGVDVSHPMLLRALRTARGMALVEGSAFRLPFGDASFDGAVSGFVLRNLDDLGAAFVELARVVKARGRISLVDVTEPRNRVVRKLFDSYFGRAAPAIGGLVGKRDAYRYLVGSLAHLPEAATICGMLEEAGFDRCGARPLSGGIATLFTGARRGEV